MPSCVNLCRKDNFFCTLSLYFFKKNSFLIFSIFITCLVAPSLAFAIERYNDEQIYSELWELEEKAAKSHSNALKTIDDRLRDAKHDKTRQAYLYLFRIGLLQRSSSDVLKAELSKAKQLFDPIIYPQLHLYSIAIDAFITQSGKGQEQKAADLLEEHQDNPRLQDNIYVNVKFLIVQLHIYFSLQQHGNITKTLVKLSKLLKKVKSQQENYYVQVNFYEGMANHNNLIGDVDQAKNYRLKQLNNIDVFSDDNANVYCGIVMINDLPLQEKFHYAKESLRVKKDGLCAPLMNRLLLLENVLLGNIERLEDLSHMTRSNYDWQDEPIAYYGGLAYLHLKDSAMALKMASLINRENSWEYQDLLRQSYQLQGDYQQAFNAAQLYQQLREKKDIEAREWMISSYQTRLELAQEDLLSAEKAKQAEQLAVVEEKAKSKILLMTTIIVAALLLILILMLYLNRSRLMQQRLQVLSDTDSLTGLLNRRAFLNRFENLKHLAERQKFVLSIAVIDLDFFKKINDQHGHLVGDAVLKAFAGAAKSTIRQTDIIGRFGGEEFVLATTQQDNSSVAGLLQRLHDSFVQQCIQDRQIAINVSFSAGFVRVYEPSKELGLATEDALRLADEELYRAKENGRRQACTTDLCFKFIKI